MADAKNSSQPQLSIGAKLAEVKRLQSDRTYRDQRGVFYLEGVRNFVQANDHQFEIDTIFWSEKLLTAPLARKLVRQARRSGVPCIALTPEQFRQISWLERASGVSAIVRQRWRGLNDIDLTSGLCWVVIETVRSLGNLGTLIRTSEAVGGCGFIVLGSRTDPFAPDVLRASMGALFRQVFVRTSVSAFQSWISRQDCCSIGASPDGSIELHQFEYPRPTLLFLGEERQGLTQLQRDLCQHLVQIPMVGGADSLNLAVAGSLILYEIYRSSQICDLNHGTLTLKEG
jgi:RNA methyltransferase, TrmH family